MDEWEYHPPPDIDESMSEHLQNFPRQPYMLVYAIRSIAALLLRGWMRVYHRMHIDGRDHLPASGSYILVCNHTSHLDTLCMLCSVPLKQVHRAFPAAAADYFFSNLPRSAVSAVLINALPFDRKAKGAESLTVCSKLLENDGNILIIFPEGTRTTTGEMGRFRSGIARLVVGTELPVIPCYLEGGLGAWPKGVLLPRPRRLHLRIGTSRSYSHLDKTTASVRAICHDLEERVAKLGRSNG
ncbi:MAG: lysophospholipid acyltransferase family protein [Woeseiaceae bacterium]|nr:lysophospholipid acyltransferase family protein [Woeseiaceae bacterium]MDX2607922.1 lysophospholipid acyltransferase family protein [Woeseiaceae bacterium]